MRQKSIDPGSSRRTPGRGGEMRGAGLARAGARRRVLLCVLVWLVALSLAADRGAAAVTQPQVSGADGAIQAAFVSVDHAERSGGNVSSLDAQLNLAIGLVQKSQSENATDPSQAFADLQNATALAQAVAAEAPAVGASGEAARQVALQSAAAYSVAVLAAAAATWAFGGRVYRRVWLRIHRDSVVARRGRHSDG